MFITGDAGSSTQINYMYHLLLVSDENIFAVEIQMDNILLMDFSQDAGQIDGYF